MTAKLFFSSLCNISFHFLLSGKSPMPQLPIPLGSTFLIDLPTLPIYL